jgi:hypothetical protein
MHGDFNAILLALEQGDSVLEVVPVFAGDSNFFILNLSLYFQFTFFDCGNNFFAFFLRNASLNQYDLSNACAECRLRSLIIKRE